MKRRTLVTGGAGFIGSHLVDYLLERGDSITVLDDFSTGSADNLVDAASRGDVRVISASILDPNAIEEAITDADRVFHLAVQCVRRSLGQPLANHEVNATGTINVLEAARRRQVRRFVYCSSSEVYGNSSPSLLNEETTVCEPMTVYGAAKLAGEYYTKAYYRTYGLPATIVRPFNAYGPREHDQGDLAEVIPRFVIRVRNGLPPVIFGSGENGRDFTYVTDTARGLAIAAEADAAVGRVVNIAFGNALTISQVADTILRLCQRPDLRPVLARSRPGDVRMLRADTMLASALLGFRAGISFEEGVEKYLHWFSKRHPDPSLLLEKEVENWQMPENAARGQ